MRRINIGKLNKRLTFERLGDIEDEMGQIKQGRQPIATVWGSLYPVRNSEFYEIQKVQSKTTHKCYIRYRPGIDTGCFIEYAGELFEIESVIDVDMEHKMLEIMCSVYKNKELIPFGRQPNAEN